MNRVSAVTSSGAAWMVHARSRLVRAMRTGSAWPAASLWLAFCLLSVTVNALSVDADVAAGGLRVAAWEPWLWEYSSFLGIAVVFWPTWWAQQRLARASGARPIRLAAWLLLSIPFSATHIAVMIAVRVVSYATLGEHYRLWGTGLRVIYEFRKDLVTFLLLSGFLLVWRSFADAVLPAGTPALPPPAPAEPSFLVPERGGATLVRARQIDWVEAQGNYVALHAGDRTHLLRQPIKLVEATLAQAQFIRTHRSALVNLARVTGLEREDDRDWVGVGIHRVPLSVSRRDAVIKALAGG